MTSTTLRDTNEARNASKDSAGEMENAKQERKAKTTRGDKFRGSEDEAPPTNTEPILVKKIRKSKRASAAPRARQVDQQHVQANENWNESQECVEDPFAEGRFSGRPHVLAPRTDNTNHRRQEQGQTMSQAGSHQRNQWATQWQRASPERPHQRQPQIPVRPQQQVAQPRPPEPPWQQLRDAGPQLQAPQAEDGDPSDGTWLGEDPPNRVITEDVMDRVHDSLDKITWDKKPSAGPSFGAGTSSTLSARGGTAGFDGRNVQLDSFIDTCILEAVATATGDPPMVTTNTSHRDRGILNNAENFTGTTPTSNVEPRCSTASAQSNRRIPEHTSPAYQNSSRNQHVFDGRGQLGSQPTGNEPPRNAPNHGNPTTPNPPSWGASANAQWGRDNMDDWGSSSGNTRYEHNGRMAMPNAQANGFAPHHPQANLGATGSVRSVNTFASPAASQSPQNPRSSFPVSRAAAVPRSNGFGEYRGPTMRVLHKNGVDKLVRDGGLGRR